jgi:hypothetical protein
MDVKKQINGDKYKYTLLDLKPAKVSELVK